VGNFQLVVWALAPSLLVLTYYYRRVAAHCYCALWLGHYRGLVWSGFELPTQLEIGIESPTTWGAPDGGRRQQVGHFISMEAIAPQTPSTIFLYTIAIALGFSEENWVCQRHCIDSRPIDWHPSPRSLWGMPHPCSSQWLDNSSGSDSRIAAKAS